MFQTSCVAGLGQSGNREVDRRVPCGCVEPRGAQPYFLYLYSLGRGQGLLHAANTRTTMHAIDVQCELCHYVLLVTFDDTPGETMLWPHCAGVPRGACLRNSGASALS